MSKLDELRVKYPRISVVTFTRLVNGDTTPTKKYLEYMLKMWNSKIEKTQNITSSEALITEVKLFYKLLPYNNNKDIYSKEYGYFTNLINKNEESSQIMEEKTFNREEHIRIIYEDDEVLLLEPKTHKGSLKYGSNTKWCTAAKKDPATFTNYVSRSCLAYLIDKTNSKGGNYSKLAFINQSSFPLSGQIEIYNQSDSHISEKTVINNGWKYNKLIELMLRYRVYNAEWASIKESRDEVLRVTNIIKGLNLESFHKHLNILQNKGETEFEGAKSILDKFISQIDESLINTTN